MGFTVGDGFLGFCNKTFKKTCLGLDGNEVVISSKLERKVRVIENIVD